MKFFRWILSHLTIIIVLSVVLYVYLTQYGFLSDEVAEPAIKPLMEPSGQQFSNNESFNNVDDFSNVEDSVNADGSVNADSSVSADNNQTEKKSVEEKVIENNSLQSPVVDRAPPSNDFFRRMKEYKLRLSSEEQKAMDNAARTFHQKLESEVKFPTDTHSKPIVKTNTVEVEDVSSEQTQNEDFEFAHVKVKKAEAPAQIKPEASSDIKIDDEAVDRQQTNPLAIQKKRVNTQDKKLQQQIRDRQKQLQDKMVLLIPLNAEKKTDTNTNTITNKKNTNIKAVKPLINTPEQKQLLNEARHAFDLHNFKVAEKKYLQLIKELPELPDVVGELANVYKTQNKTPEYLVTNTQFVKRLVSHHRFNEAWNVVIVTDKIDKKTANKQRRIINNKQKELQ